MLDFNNRFVNFTLGCIFIVFVVAFLISFQSKKTVDDTSYNTYNILIDNVEGIRNGQKIFIGGAPVGYIKLIKLKNNDLILQIKVDKKIELTTDTMAKVTSSSLFTSSKLVSLINGIEEEYLQNNATITYTAKAIDLDQLLNMVSYYLKSKIKK